MTITQQLNPPLFSISQFRKQKPGQPRMGSLSGPHKASVRCRPAWARIWRPRLGEKSGTGPLPQLPRGPLFLRETLLAPPSRLPWLPGGPLGQGAFKTPLVLTSPPNTTATVLPNSAGRRPMQSSPCPAAGATSPSPVFRLFQVTVRWQISRHTGHRTEQKACLSLALPQHTQEGLGE